MSRGRALGIAAGLAALALLHLGPLAWLLVSSLQPERDLLRFPPTLWPRRVTAEHYAEILGRGSDFYRALGHSLAVAVATTALCLALGALGAYALARLRFPGRRRLYFLVLLTYMLPGVALLIPTILLLRALGLVGSYAGLVVSYLPFFLTLTIWVLRGFFLAVPPDLEQAAQVDGCTRVEALWRVILPLSAPGLGATAIIVFIMTWNEYMYAKVIGSTRFQTLPVYVLTLANQQFRSDAGILSAAALVTMAPVVLLVIGFQRLIVAGLTEGALKD